MAGTESVPERDAGLDEGDVRPAGLVTGLLAALRGSQAYSLLSFDDVVVSGVGAGVAAVVFVAFVWLRMTPVSFVLYAFVGVSLYNVYGAVIGALRGGEAFKPLELQAGVEALVREKAFMVVEEAVALARAASARASWKSAPSRACLEALALAYFCTGLTFLTSPRVLLVIYVTLVAACAADRRLRADVDKLAATIEAPVAKAVATARATLRDAMARIEAPEVVALVMPHGVLAAAAGPLLLSLFMGWWVVDAWLFLLWVGSAAIVAAAVSEATSSDKAEKED